MRANRKNHPPQSKSAVADFDHFIEWPKPAYTRFRQGEGRTAGGDDPAFMRSHRVVQERLSQSTMYPGGPTQQAGQAAPATRCDPHSIHPERLYR